MEAKTESSYSGKLLSKLQDPVTIDFYEPYALTELSDGRIIYFTLKNYQIIVMSISLKGHEDDIIIKIGGTVSSIIQLKNDVVIYSINNGIIELINLKKNSYGSIQKIENEEDYIIKLVELNDLNFISIMSNNSIKLFQKSNDKYENTKVIKYESQEYFLSGIESSINNNLLIISFSKFLFVDIYNEKVIKEIKAGDNEDCKGKKEISPFVDNCLKYKNTIIVAGIDKFYLIDCIKQEIIKKIKNEYDFPCCSLTRFVDGSFITGSGFGEMLQFIINEKGDDLIFICQGALYLDRVTTCVYSKCGRLIIGEYNGLVILSYYD